VEDAEKGMMQQEAPAPLHFQARRCTAGTPAEQRNAAPLLPRSQPRDCSLPSPH